MKLTQKQQTLLDFIASYMTRNSRSPLIREIQEGCQVASYKSVVDRLNSLERKGLLKRHPNKHRGIQLGHLLTQIPDIASVMAEISTDVSLIVQPGGPQVE